MSKAQLPKTQRFAAGMNTLAPNYAMPEGSVRDATNMDVTNEGVLRTRDGYSAAARVSGVRCHSLYADVGMMLHADGNSLKRTIGPITETVSTGLQPASPVCYATLPTNEIVWSDGISIGKVSASGNSVPLGLAAPSSPVLSTVANGLLKAGTYQFAVTWAKATGEESTPSLPISIKVIEGAGVVLSGLPTSAPSGVVAIQIYASHADEGVLFLATSVMVGTSTARIDAPPSGRPLETLFESPFPACTSLAFAAGRLLGFRGNALYWSEPFRFGVTRPAKNFIQFSQPGSLIAPTQDGVYVGTLGANSEGEVGFLSGFDFGNQPYRQVTPYPAYPGTLVNFPHTTQMVWASPEGFVVADNGGQIANISMDKVAFPSARRGGSMLREQNGMRQIVSSLQQYGPDNDFAVTDYAEADIIKGASNG